MGKLQMGYSHIFCIIDMDTKDREPERSQYPVRESNKIYKPVTQILQNFEK